MKISINWLNEYLEHPVNYTLAAEILTQTGLEVEDISTYESIPGSLKGVVIGKIVKKEKHPDADRLSVTWVDIGQDEPVQIVCGAPNVEEGQTVVVAKPGSVLNTAKGPLEIKKSKIRGVESHGMICAEDEIGVGTSHDGIMVLPDSLKAGQPASDYFKNGIDTVLELNITPNRVDATSHIGTARDIVAFLNAHGKKTSLKIPASPPLEYINQNPAIQVRIESPAACIRYSGILIEGIEVKPSPEWMQHKLQAIGIKPINNIVDITNYVLFETGQPLHAFDADKISQKTIVVKLAQPEEKFITLDGNERILTGADLMIADPEKNLCLAGVYGGLNSGVTEKTTRVFIESACFHPAYIRKTSRHHGLHTDASFRFERGTDPNFTLEALQRAVHLITEIAGGKISGTASDWYPEPIAPFRIQLSWKKLDEVSGIDFPKHQAIEILQSLGISIVETWAEGIIVDVPTNKVDVTREIDLIEEIMRIFGYDQIPLRSTLKAVFKNEFEKPQRRFRQLIASYLSANGFHEIVSLSLDHSKHYQPLDEAEKSGLIYLENPISSELDVMRKTLLYSAMKVAAHNMNHKNLNLKLFEFGKVYQKHTDNTINNKKNNPYAESHRLGILISGNMHDDNWYEAQVKADFFALNGICQSILKQLRISFLPVIRAEKEHPDFDELFVVHAADNQQKMLYQAGKISKKTLKQFDIKQEIWYAEMYWDYAVENIRNSPPEFRDIPRYPMVQRDLALLLDKHVNYRKIEELALKTIKKKLHQVTLFDVYEGKNLPDNKKSYAVRFTFWDPVKTFTDKEVDAFMDRLMQVFKEEIGAEIRKN
ncbi:MAG: phenylalanine--tRNA ligase subunit beta [Flavobacteriales bacterium]|nr:phenylalanine--tRNA ligase subunit beta [Flavobacteriales bacterium]